MRAGPADIAEYIQDYGKSFQADQPVAAILRRTKNRVMTPQRPERRLDMAGADIGNIASDNHGRARRQGIENPLHAMPQITAGL